MKKLSIILALISFQCFGQMNETEVKAMIAATEEPKLVVECSRFLQENFFHFADLVTDKLLSVNPKNGNYNYRKGFILLGMNKSPELALKHLEIAAEKTEINYDIYSPKETSAPIDVFYYIGVCHHRMGNLDKALEFYNKFMNETQKGSTLIPIATRKIAQVGSAKAMGIYNSNAVLMDINSPFNEFCPIVSAEGKSLSFSSTRPRTDNSSAAYVEPMFNALPSDIYQTTLNKVGSWSSAQLFSMNDKKTDEVLSFLSQNERALYYSSWNDPTIYSSLFEQGSFTAPKQITLSVANGKEKAAPYSMQFIVSTDGKMGFFVSNALSGKGGWDLFMVEKKGDQWGEATNLSMLNSDADEMAPFLSLDGKTLYFSSDNAQSIGGFDIFKATRDVNGMWSKPTNLGYSVNSFSDEVGFSMIADGTKGYVSSNRIGTSGMYDIFSMDLKENQSGISVLDGRIVNTKGNAIPEQSYVTLRCLNCTNNMETVIAPRMRDGEFVSVLEQCKEYELAYYYGPLTNKPYRNRFKTTCQTGFEWINKKVLIIDEDQVIVPFPTYEIKGVVVDMESGSPIADAQVNLSIDGKTTVVKSGANGIYRSDAIASYEFESHLTGDLNANADGYLSASSKVNTDLLEDSVITVNFKLEATQKGFIGPYMVNYQFDRYNLTDISKNKLKEVIKIMNDNPSLAIEIRSHTDSRGPSVYNQRLSDMRAKTAMNYIKQYVVNPSRITAKGYGETELLKPCGDGVTCSEADHLANRRTEFIILK